MFSIMNPRLTRSISCFLFFLLNLGWLSCTTIAQEFDLEVPICMDPVGSGARAVGMGGAFIAIADDATAAAWNPGGLVQLENPEISIVANYFKRIDINRFGNDAESEGAEDVSGSQLNYLSAVYPFTWLNRNMVVSAIGQYVYDFSRDLEFSATYPLDPQTLPAQVDGDIDVHHIGGLAALGLAYSVQITPTISAGMTFNIWQDNIFGQKFSFESDIKGPGLTDSGDTILYDQSRTDTYSFRGFNTNLGFVWNATNRLTLGLVFKTPFTLDLTHNITSDEEIIFPDDPNQNQSNSIDSETNDELDIPMAYGIGFAYRFSDQFTTSFDCYRIEWDDFIYRFEDGREISPITGDPADEANIEPTTQFRVGGEYLILADPYVIPIRGGLFYDQAPAQGGFDDFFGFSCGTGLARGRGFFDIAYQYRYGKDVAKFILDEYDFSQDTEEHLVYTSLIYHF